MSIQLALCHTEHGARPKAAEQKGVDVAQVVRHDEQRTVEWKPLHATEAQPASEQRTECSATEHRDDAVAPRALAIIADRKVCWEPANPAGHAPMVGRRCRVGVNTIGYPAPLAHRKSSRLLTG